MPGTGDGHAAVFAGAQNSRTAASAASGVTTGIPPGAETLAVMFLVLDSEGTIQSGNRSAARLLPASPPCPTVALSDLVHADDIDAVLAAIRAVGAGGPRAEVVARFVDGSGSAPDVYIHLVLSRDETQSQQGSGSRVLVQGWDVTPLMNRVHELEAHAFHDSLTGLANRSTFMDRLHQEVNRSARTGTDVAVMFADIDGFTSVNDRHGHETGDHVLVHVSRCLTDCLRPADTLARLGGDEFAIICPDINSPQQAMTIAERLRNRVMEPMILRQRRIAITLSIGVAFAVDDDHEDPAAALLRRADEVMYELKRAHATTTTRSSGRP